MSLLVAVSDFQWREVVQHTLEFQSARAVGMQEACRVNAYIVRAARCTATLDAGYQLAALGLGHDLGEGDTL
ncbi:hypothetical protein ACFVY1_44345 [Streptomyces sp. NPDC058293]|uniref:hypothetical protein n=1 Tax=unclassified Streptomyces TaxID=2593676 RepID=UPI0033AECFD1